MYLHVIVVGCWSNLRGGGGVILFNYRYRDTTLSHTLLLKHGITKQSVLCSGLYWKRAAGKKGRVLFLLFYQLHTYTHTYTHFLDWKWKTRENIKILRCICCHGRLTSLLHIHPSSQPAIHCQLQNQQLQQRHKNCTSNKPHHMYFV